MIVISCYLEDLNSTTMVLAKSFITPNLPLQTWEKPVTLPEKLRIVQTLH